MWVTNEEYYGHLTDERSFDITLSKPEFYILSSNQYDWEQRYIHPLYHKQVKEDFVNLQPCTDVHLVPIVTAQFCDDLITIIEDHGKWSSGKNEVCKLY